MNQGEERKAWDRQPGETPKGYQAFQDYIALPPSKRTFQEAYNRYKGFPEGQRSKTPPGSFTHWTSANEWKKRAEAYDNDIVQSELDKTKLFREQTLIDAWTGLREGIALLKDELGCATLDEKLRIVKELREFVSRFSKNDGSGGGISVIQFDLGVEMDGGEV